MGNEESQYSEIEIEEEAVEVRDNWSLHNAKDDVYKYSAFIGHSKASSTSQLSLESLAKNLMTHRHPCILKYISSWNRANKFHLITEEIKPLSLVLPCQTTLQICIGLHRILSAITFLHEKAFSSHNNICCASIYVTTEGVWKLGGLEFLKKFSDVSISYLRGSRTSRYEKAIAPEEDSFTSISKINAAAIDTYAFGVLVDELLKKKSNSEIHHLTEFREYCKKQLLNPCPDKRSNLSEVLEHPFFSHDFIKISQFLFDLPLKTSNEKEEFFSDLVEQLSLLPEDIVGCQLTTHLLSRVVLLDCSAQKHLLPVLLQPKTDKKKNDGALFSEDIFRKYVIPKLLKIFSVRDVQIRIILLSNFNLFCHVFTTDELKYYVLPEMLVGIKDVNDQLVSMTLKALSQLVLLLGSSVVIGGKRCRLFTDGRPKSQLNVSALENKNKGKDKKVASEILFTGNSLPERLSPDGGEDNASSSNFGGNEEDTEHWADWEISNDKDSVHTPETVLLEHPTDFTKNEEVKPEISKEITFLDIKSNIKEKTSTDDFDFFRDMEPVISKTQVLSIRSSKTIFDVEGDEPETNWESWSEDLELNEQIGT